MLKTARSLVTILWLVVGLLATGCEMKQPARSPSAKSSAPTQSVSASTPTGKATVNPSDTIKICSFNIQVFGVSKMKKPQAMDVLTRVVRRFDVVAIQEVRSTDQTVVPKFVEMINADGSKYDFVLGPRLGRTSSKEQYAVLFNTDRIELDRGSVYTVDDPQDLLHREPMVARFRVRGPPPDQAFTFSLVDIHTDPDETTTELDALGDVFSTVERQAGGGDVILVGDLNVDEHHFGKLGQLPGIAHAITGMTTNTRRNKMYDNIVFNQQAGSEYTGRSGVLDLQNEFNLTEEAALEISDHCPVWAEFSAIVSPSNVANRAPATTR